MAPARIDWAKMRELAGWFLMSINAKRVTLDLMPIRPLHWERGATMSGILINLIIQAIGGAVGGNAIGATLKNLNLGPLGNTIAGALGGAGGGSILSSLIPALAGGAGGLDIATIAGQLVGGGATGALVTAIVGAVMNAMKK